MYSKLINPNTLAKVIHTRVKLPAFLTRLSTLISSLSPLVSISLSLHSSQNVNLDTIASLTNLFIRGTIDQRELRKIPILRTVAITTSQNQHPQNSPSPLIVPFPRRTIFLWRS